MILSIIVYINITLLLLIALLHFYWALGGNWAINTAIPDKFKDRYHNPKYKWHHTIATFIVAFGLMAFALIIAANYFTPLAFMPSSLITYCTPIIGSIFILRAIGDFNNFGLFKRASDSLFAKYDTLIFVPLCLILGINGMLIAFFS